jgi:Amt family ammonium transporter
VRKKNVFGTMMQSFAMNGRRYGPMGAGRIQSGVRRRSSFIGSLQYLFLHGVGSAANADYAATIPPQIFMVYQLMFAIITPALITGSFAERMKFSAMIND